MPDVTDKEGKPLLVGYGLSMERLMQCTLEDGAVHTWTERWLVTQSLAHARRQQTGLQERLTKTIAELSRLKPNPMRPATVIRLELNASSNNASWRVC